MMKLQKWIAAALALAMLFALAACGAKVPGDQAQQQDSDSGRADEAKDSVVTLAAPGKPGDAAADYSDDTLNRFVAKSLPVIMSRLDGENRVYSPANICMALGMLAEITDGNTRAQILELLGEDDLDALRSDIGALWAACSREDEYLTVLPASSMWLRDDFNYKSEVFRALEEHSFASAFRGPMGSEAYDEALHNWINEQTRHLLEEQANQLHFDPQTVLALVSTLYFKGSWSVPFSESATTKDSFHAASGDREVDFMHRSDTTRVYYGEHFSAISLYMADGAAMWILLPDEDSSLDALVSDPEAAAFLADGYAWENAKNALVRLSLPRFDVDSDLSLSDTLKALGVTDVFDPNVSDFTPVTDEVPLFVSQAIHAARVKIDEKGCEAAAFTYFAVAAGAPQEEPEIIDFTVDRPFLFAVKGPQGEILFLGAVNEI